VSGDVRSVTIQLERPRGLFPGKIGTGHYIERDGTVLLVDKETGSPIDRIRFGRKLKPGEDAKAVACVLTRQRLSKKLTDFNRPIHYPKAAF
jgi:hypothetical protein